MSPNKCWRSLLEAKRRLQLLVLRTLVILMRFRNWAAATGIQNFVSCNYLPPVDNWTFCNYYVTYQPQFSALKTLRPEADVPLYPPSYVTD